MSENLRVLARNMRKEQEKRIVYNNRASSWKTIFKHHPLESNRNESLFHNMEHCKEYIGAGGANSKDTVITLRTAYTWSNLLKISENSLQDCLTFYDIAKHTFLNNWSILRDSNDNWFKKALTAIYLSKDNAPESMNFLSQLNQEQKETTLALAFQYFGKQVLPKYEKHKSEFNIQNFNEKLVFWYWAADARENNFIDQVIEELNTNKKIVFDTEYLANKFQSKHLLKSQSAVIDQRFVPFKDILVETQRYVARSEKLYCVMNEESEKTSLKNIYNLFCCQSLIKQLEIKLKDKNSPIVMIGEVREPNFAGFLGEFKYDSIEQIFNDYPLTNESKNSMEKFIELNRSNIDCKKDPIYWSNVQSVFLTHVLNDSLEIKEKLKNKKIKV